MADNGSDDAEQITPELATSDHPENRSTAAELAARKAGAAEEPGEHVQRTVGFLMERLQFHIDHYLRRRRTNRQGAKIGRGAAIFAGAMTTILLGIRSLTPFRGYEEYFSSAALVLSATATALTTWEGFADYHWKWVTYRSTLFELYTIRDDLKFEMEAGNIVNTRQLEIFYDRLRSALKDTAEKWVDQRMTAFGAGTAAQGGIKNNEKANEISRPLALSYLPASLFCSGGGGPGVSCGVDQHLQPGGLAAHDLRRRGLPAIGPAAAVPCGSRSIIATAWPVVAAAVAR
jgi:hypothetical protein